MKLLILGISGRTGNLIAHEAIRRGHEVVGIARDPGKVTVKTSSIIEGTPYEFETVLKAVEGCNAVISALNTFSESPNLFRKIKAPLDTMSVSMKNTIKAMDRAGIRRIVVMTAFGVEEHAYKLPFIFRFLLKISNIKYVYEDHARQEKLLVKSALDWTVVRPVGLTDENHNLSVLYNIDGQGTINASVSRNAVAHFMLDCVEKENFIRQKPAISNE